MGFGISFGSNKSKSTQTENKNETQTTSQTQSSNENQQTTGVTNTNQTGSTTNAGTSTSQQNQSTAGTQNTTGTQAATTSSLDSTTLSGLQTLVQSLMGQSGQGATSGAVSNLVSQLGNFDAGSYVANATTAANQQAKEAIDSGTGVANSQIGGTASTNSAAALLDTQIRNSANATAAGEINQANQTAQGILNTNAGTAIGAQSSQQGYLATLLDALKGSTQTTAGTSSTGTTSATTSGTTSTGATTEAGTSASNTGTTTNQNVATTIDQLLNGITNTTGTDVTTGTTKKSGGGLSLGL